MTGSGGRTVRIEINDVVATIVLDRPEAANAIDLHMLGEIGRSLDTLEANPSIRCLIVTGAGKVFSAGGDIEQMRQLTAEQGEAFVAEGQTVLERLASSRMVVIAALNGHALGGGLELALACDIRIADMRATIGFPEVGLGLIPGWGGTQRAAHLLGHSRASLLVLTGDRLAARDAERLGLVDQVVEDGTVREAAGKLADRIGSNSPVAVAASKRALMAAQRSSYAEGFQQERQVWRDAFATHDRVEGLTAFLEKRRPNWTNSG
jgi:enoyl-CoA hydratase/carnithine racemase